MTVKELWDWLHTLPPEMDNEPVCGDLYGSESPAKRVIAFRYKDKSGGGIVTNPLGSHLKDAFFEYTETISIIHCDGGQK